MVHCVNGFEHIRLISQIFHLDTSANLCKLGLHRSRGPLEEINLSLMGKVWQSHLIQHSHHAPHRSCGS